MAAAQISGSPRNGVDDAGVEDAPYIFNSSEDDDMESMQLDALFPEDYEGDEQDNQPRDRSDSASARGHGGDAPRGNSDSGRQNDEDGATRAQSPHPMSQQNRSEGGGSKKPRKRRHRKRYRPYAKNITEVHIHARTAEVRNYMVARGQRKPGENMDESDYDPDSGSDHDGDRD